MGDFEDFEDDSDNDDENPETTHTVVDMEQVPAQCLSLIEPKQLICYAETIP